MPLGGAFRRLQAFCDGLAALLPETPDGASRAAAPRTATKGRRGPTPVAKMTRSAPKIPVSAPVWLHLRPPSPPAPWEAGDGGGRRSQDCWVRRHWEASRRRATTASQRQDWARQRLVGQNPAPFAPVGAQNIPNPLADSADSPRAVCQKPSIHRQEGFCRKHYLAAFCPSSSVVRNEAAHGGHSSTAQLCHRRHLGPELTPGVLIVRNGGSASQSENAECEQRRVAAG